MKKLILVLLAVLVILPITSQAFGFLNITNAQLMKLDASTYRLRVTYDWGGTLLNAQVFPTLMLGPQIPKLSSFNITGGGSQFNFFNQSSTSLLSHVGTTWSSRSTGNQFGFDFSASNPLASSFTFLDQGQITWHQTSQVPYLPGISTFNTFSENFNGQFTLPADPSVVPEPASVLLLGLGLAGAVIVKRRK